MLSDTSTKPERLKLCPQRERKIPTGLARSGAGGRNGGERERKILR